MNKPKENPENRSTETSSRYLTPTKSSKLKQRNETEISERLETGPGPGDYSISQFSQGVSHAFTRGLRVKDRKKVATGPGLYKPPENYSRIGGVMTPKRGVREKNNESPGPAAYSPISINRTSAYSIGRSSRYLDKRKHAPGPGSYDLPQIRESHSAMYHPHRTYTSLRPPMNLIPEHPGPGAYNSAIVQKAPSIFLLSKKPASEETPIPVLPNQGPGSYSPKKVLPVSPSWGFGTSKKNFNLITTSKISIEWYNSQKHYNLINN